ncbi:MAG: choice-of-anchor Q domain-containing protein, partial [Acidimicrobiales bacterium]
CNMLLAASISSLARQPTSGAMDSRGGDSLRGHIAAVWRHTRKATLLALVAMIAVACANASSDEPATTEEPSAAVVEATPIGTPVPTVESPATAAPTSTPSPTATPIPTPTPTPMPEEICDVSMSNEGSFFGDGTVSYPFDTFEAALASTFSGDVLCVLPGRYDAGFQVTTSGTEDRPITIRGFEGTSVESIAVFADDVIVEHFDISGATRIEGSGVFIDGQRVTVRHNTIHDMVGIGVGCIQTFAGEPARCVEATIVDNTIWAIDGWGIWVWGEDHFVARNDISRVFAASHQDADAIRFFGSGHEFRQNYIHDIFESDAQNGRDPHSDCFQTYDVLASYAPLEDIVIAQNVCSTDRHGIIMTALNGSPARNIVIENNVFVSDGVAVVLLIGDSDAQREQYRDVTIANNLITGDVDYEGIQAYGGAEVDLFNNLFLGDFVPFAGSSLQPGAGSFVSNNVEADATDFVDISDGDVRRRYRLAAGSVAIDSGLDTNAPAQDLNNAPRPVDGTGDGVAVTDIGPYEYQNN